MKDKESLISTHILKVAILIGSGLSLILRYDIEEMYVNLYMGIVNTLSFIVSYNILLVSTYQKIKEQYEDHKTNSIKPNAKNAVMVSYIFIFLINIVIWIILWYIYTKKNIDYALVNDTLGILSLCLALTTDFLSEFIENIVSYIFIR